MTAIRRSRFFVFARYLVCLSYAAMYILLFYGCWFYGPNEALASVVLWLLVSLGLTLVLPGVVRNRRRSYLWLCFIVMLYFIWAVQALFSQRVDAAGDASFIGGWFNYLLVIDAVLIFVGAMLAARWFPSDD